MKVQRLNLGGGPAAVHHCMYTRHQHQSKKNANTTTPWIGGIRTHIRLIIAWWDLNLQEATWNTPQFPQLNNSFGVGKVDLHTRVNGRLYPRNNEKMKITINNCSYETVNHFCFIIFSFLFHISSFHWSCDELESFRVSM